MDKKRLWVVITVFAMVVIVGGGWLIGIAPQLAVVATANQSRASVELENAKNQILLSRLKKDYQNIETLKKELDSLRTAVPSSAEISTFVTVLNELADSRQITVKSISVNDAKPYTPVAAAPASTTDKALGAAVTNLKITAANFIIIPVQFSVAGEYVKVLDFVNDVQTGSRLFFLSTFSIIGSTTATGTVNREKNSAASTSEKVDSTIGGYLYVLLGSSKK
jgi:Tfp pilus assembly protein PilO